MKSEDITGGLDLLGDFLDAKGYTEEAGLCTRAMDEINRLRDGIDECLYWINKDRDKLEERNEEISRMRIAMHAIYEVYAGSDSTRPERYWQDRIQEMAYIAGKHKRGGGGNE